MFTIEQVTAEKIINIIIVMPDQRKEINKIFLEKIFLWLHVLILHLEKNGMVWYISIIVPT